MSHYHRLLPKSDEPARSAIAKDRDRIIHCSAFRRLQGKSQVFGAHVTDFFRNRLTHSLECAQIGRAIARRAPDDAWSACADSRADFEVLCEAACLAHDIGHPPFGHNGEAELSRCMQRYARTRFEGNAQSFRIVTFVEPKELAPLADDHERWIGLNLTRATLKAILKYPWLESDARVDPTHPKFSVYNDPLDREYFDWLFQGDDPERTFATNVLDLADDIAYATHDFEDGVWSGMIPLFDVALKPDDAAIASLHVKLREKHPHLTIDVLVDAIEELFRTAYAAAKFSDSELQWIARPFERSRENVSYLKRLSAALVGMFIESVSREVSYAVADETTRLQIDILTSMAWVWMIERSDLTTRQYGQRKIIRDLFQGYVRDSHMLPRQRELNEIRDLGLEEDEERRQIMVLIRDHIAGMTDQYAISAHEEMFKGHSPFEVRYAY